MESISTLTQTSDEIENETNKKTDIRPYLIALCIESSLLVISVGLLVVALLKLRQKSKENEACKPVSSGENMEAIQSMESAENANKQSECENV